MPMAERLLQGDVRRRVGRARAVPVLLTRRNPHHVARTDFADRAAPGLSSASGSSLRSWIVFKQLVMCSTTSGAPVSPPEASAGVEGV
jgi:hypothetical protein